MPRPDFRRFVPLLFLLALCVRPLRAQASADIVHPSMMTHSLNEDAPVMLRGKELSRVHGILSFPADARAEAIGQHLEQVARDLTFDPANIKVNNYASTTDIAAGRLVLTSITNLDASFVGTNRQALAESEAAKIRSAISEARGTYSRKALIHGSALAFITTALLFFLLWSMARIFPRLYRALEHWCHLLIPALRIQDFQVISSDRAAEIAVALARFVRVALTIALLYAWASLCLRFFPWTHAYSETLVAYITTPLAAGGHRVLDYLPKLFTIAIIVFVATYIIKFTRLIFSEIGKGNLTISGFHEEWAQPTYKIVRVLLLVLTLIVIFPYLPGAKTPAFQGITIFLGVLISFGSSSAVANIVAGVILTYMRAFRIGDRVQIADTTGDVIECSLLVTRVRTIKNVEITIANSQVLAAHIVNYSAAARNSEGLILHTTTTLGYDVPWDTAHKLLIEAAMKTDGIIAEPKPFILQTALDDSYVAYELNAYTNQPQRMAVLLSELHRNIHVTFDEAGVEVMSPTYYALRQSKRSTVPGAEPLE
ncbi:mechanosensitive ion channel family protein [Granulicella cerasi]|uniref:Mechanosensitive ion channel family protein n=1 Tax=Granulicella cerasi TaxID=741063 RepID=A0ABW1Z9G4_9BACT|nr:mechanosensitive ion channel family protein [Granulicella cerasi]